MAIQSAEEFLAELRMKNDRKRGIQVSLMLITARDAAIRAQERAWTEEDEALPEDDAIEAAHPCETGDHAVYVEALRLVGAKRSKYALVDLVNWLLVNARAQPVPAPEHGDLSSRSGAKAEGGAERATPCTHGRNIPSRRPAVLQ